MYYLHSEKARCMTTDEFGKQFQYETKESIHWLTFNNFLTNCFNNTSHLNIIASKSYVDINKWPRITSYPPPL